MPKSAIIINMQRDHERLGFVLLHEDIIAVGGNPPVATFVPDAQAPYLMKRIDEALERMSSLTSDITPVAANRMEYLMYAHRQTKILQGMVKVLSDTMANEVEKFLRGDS